MRIGIDIDGCLADFNSSYIALTMQLTGRDLFPARPFEPTVWEYPESFGYMHEEMAEVWRYIANSETFWTTLQPLPETRAALNVIVGLIQRGHDVYFITDRPGKGSKRQTEQWLAAQTGGMTLPTYTVLVSADKAACAKALRLDYYIDDKFENARAVECLSPAKSYLLNRPWNLGQKAVYATRIDSVMSFLASIPA